MRKNKFKELYFLHFSNYKNEIRGLLEIARLISDLENIILEYLQPNANLLHYIMHSHYGVNIELMHNKSIVKCQLCVDIYSSKCQKSNNRIPYFRLVLIKYPYVYLIPERTINLDELFNLIFKYSIDTYVHELYQESFDGEFHEYLNDKEFRSSVESATVEFLKEFIDHFIWDYL